MYTHVSSIVCILVYLSFFEDVLDFGSRHLGVEDGLLQLPAERLLPLQHRAHRLRHLPVRDDLLKNTQPGLTDVTITADARKLRYK